MQAEDIMQQWLEGLSPHTQRSYRTAVRLFEARAGVTWLAATSAHVQEWRRSMEDAGLLRSTIGQRLTALSSLYEFTGRTQPVSNPVRAAAMREAGKELLLHLPMEPEGAEDPGPGALLTGHTAAEIERLLDAALASVPGAVGVNNHMGSKATADRAFMDVLLDALGRRGLFFVDSRTTSLTVAASEAERLGVPYLARKVFLDAVDGGIEGSLAGAVDAAARGGAAVAIGHVQTDGLAAILRRAADGMRRSGVKPATLSALIASHAGKAAE